MSRRHRPLALCDQRRGVSFFLVIRLNDHGDEATVRAGDRMTAWPERHEILAALLAHRTVDIVTTGARTGQLRTTEIWVTIIGGDVYLCGTPNASDPEVERKPRDWLANLIAHPSFLLRLKQDVHVDLPADAEPVRDIAERRRILKSPQCEYYVKQSKSLDHAIRDSPMVRLTFVDQASWLSDALRAVAAEST
jgi:hypothetical protein